MLKKSILPLVCVAVAAMFASCGSGEADPTDAASLKDNVISMAEKNVLLEESAVIGTMPSIYAQREAALDSLSKITKNAIEKAMPENEGELEAAMKKAEEIKAAGDAAEESVKEYFDAKLQEMGQQFVGKEFPCKFDAEQYSAVVAKITKFEDGRCYVDVALTLSAPIEGRAKYIEYEFLDADGNVVNHGADYSIDYKKCNAGDKFNKEISPRISDLSKIVTVNFKKSK